MREHESATAGPVELRAADADRSRVADALQRHYLEGRLTSEEFDERLGQALAARTHGELDALLRDLPSAPEPTTRPQRLPRRGTKPNLRAQVHRYVMVMALLVLIWALTTPGGYFWPIWPMLGWGIGLASQSMGVCGRGRMIADR